MTTPYEKLKKESDDSYDLGLEEWKEKLSKANAWFDKLTDIEKEYVRMLGIPFA